MRKVLVTEAGGPLGLSLTRALHNSPERMHIIGVDTDAPHACRAEADEVHLIPHAWDADFLPVLRSIVTKTGAEMIWPCRDEEIALLAGAGDVNASLFLPGPDVVAICQDKMVCRVHLAYAGVPTPSAMLLTSPQDLKKAFTAFGGAVWLRATSGSGGRGALSVTEAEFDKASTWITLNHGWGSFMASEVLPGKGVTWESIWDNGHLLFSQGSVRQYWEHSNMTMSGVTGIVGAFRWMTDPAMDAIAEAAVEAVASRPHGVFTVDMTCDAEGTPRVTEINAGRFAQAGVAMFADKGLNAPYCATRLALDKGYTIVGTAFSPYPTDTIVVRGIDVAPKIRPAADIEARSYAAPFYVRAA